MTFIHERCQDYSGKIDRALIDGKLKLPADLNIESDSQIYTLNWPSRLDRRNMELSCYCSVDAKSRFILGMHSNYDDDVDPFKINKDAAMFGDMALPEAFREHAQYWLVGDELKAGRALARKYKLRRDDLEKQIRNLYEDAATREDVENIETTGPRPWTSYTVPAQWNADTPALYSICSLVPAAPSSPWRWR